MIARAPLLLALICLTAGPALAQETAPGTDGGRYSLQEVRAGYLRLDRASGEVSLCRQRDVGWTCDLIADDRTAYSDEILRLEKEKSVLERRVAALEQRLDAIIGLAERPVDSGVAPKTSTVTPDASMDAEIDKALDVTERAMRRFFGIIQGLKDDYQTDEPGQQ
jgi:hypothetical protein